MSEKGFFQGYTYATWAVISLGVSAIILLEFFNCIYICLLIGYLVGSQKRWQIVIQILFVLSDNSLAFWLVLVEYDNTGVSLEQSEVPNQLQNKVLSIPMSLQLDV